MTDEEWPILENGEPWPHCRVIGCKNGACLRLNSPYCYPHSKTKKDEIMKLMIYGKLLRDGCFSVKEESS